jgi:tRNA A-37 threonylcarbamoyl transferase component Bud32
LQAHRIPTPDVLYQGTDSSHKIQTLIFKRINNSKTLDEVWNTQSHPDDIWEALSNVIVELATQHVFGIVQQDLHLKNFLLTDKIIYTLDGAQIKLFEPILPKKESLENLAIFLSQLGAGQKELQLELYEHYASARGWTIKQEDVAFLLFEIKHNNEMRWFRYEKKIFRNCTTYKRVKTFTKVGMYDRAYDGPEFQQFLQNPDSVFANADVTMLKNGRSSTVIKTVIDGRHLVIKRYNLKDTLHRLRRTLRPTRASACWRLANKLSLFGIATAKPIAYLENNILGMHGVSYYVTEDVPGNNLFDYLHQHNAMQDKTARGVVFGTVKMLKNLAQIEVTHGDLKATNILIGLNDKPVLIDLDGAREHLSLSGLRRAWKSELNRFLRNFDGSPQIRELFEVELQG